MPRNLTDLMEAAVSAAPPETHHAADITQLAARRQRRRTSLIAGGAALAVIAAAGVTVGLTQHAPTTPEPTDGFLHDQTVDVSSAVPASAVRGFRTVPWTMPSVQKVVPDQPPVPTFIQVSSTGRLLVQHYTGSHGGVGGGPVRLYAAPGQGATRLPQPHADAQRAPSFLDDGRLLWTPVAFHGISTGLDGDNYVTGPDGANPESVERTVKISATGSADAGHPWISGDRQWFTAYHSSSLKGGINYSLYNASFSGDAVRVASNVASADVADGMAAWVTTDGQVMAESTDGGSPHTISVPLSPGCRMPSTQVLQSAVGSNYLSVNRSLIALMEACGDAQNPDLDLLAFDMAGHPLVHVTGVYALNPTLGTDGVAFDGVDTAGRLEAYRYDLRTGGLARLSSQGVKQQIQATQAAGDYVLWYDASGGHVGHFSR